MITAFNAIALQKKTYDAPEENLASVRKMLDSKDAVWREPYVSVRLPFRLAEDWESPFQAVTVGFVPFIHRQMAFGHLPGEDGRSTLIIYPMNELRRIKRKE